MGSGRSAARPEAVAGAVVRIRIGFGGRIVARMRHLGRRRIVTVMRFGPGFFGGDADHGMPGTAVMLAFTHGGGLQVLRDHEARDQQNPRHRWKSAPSIAPDQHVPILRPPYRLSNPAMARELTRRQFGAMEFASPLACKFPEY